MTESALTEELERVFESLFDETDRTIAQRRTLCLENPETLEVLGADLGLSRERIRQREDKLRRRIQRGARNFTGSLSNEIHRFSSRIGDALIQEDAASHLPKSLSESASFREPTTPLLFFLYLAGPYALWEDLLVRQDLRTKVRSLSEQTWAALRCNKKVTVEEADRFADWHGITSPDIVNQVLDNLQSKHAHVYDLPGGNYVFEPKAADRAVRELQTQGVPLNIEELSKRSGVSAGTLRNCVLSDERIVRLDRSMYGLREWGHEKYDGIVASIHRAIDVMGGHGQLEDIADWVTRHFNVSWNSVVAYASSHHGFLTSNGVVRVRKPDDPPAVADYRELGEVGDCLEIDGLPALRVKVDQSLWRGSGHRIPRNWAVRAGLSPGQKLNLENGTGAINLSWVGREPTLGSLRSLATENGWPQSGLAFIILAEDELRSIWRQYPPEPSEDPATIARAMGCLFAFAEPTQRHPLSGDFWMLLGERLGLQAHHRVPGTILARLKSRREKIVEPYVEALRESLLISEARGLVIQLNI